MIHSFCFHKEKMAHQRSFLLPFSFTQTLTSCDIVIWYGCLNRKFKISNYWVKDSKCKSS